MDHTILTEIEKLSKAEKTSTADEELLSLIIKQSESALYAIKARRNGLINDPHENTFIDGATLTEPI